MPTTSLPQDPSLEHLKAQAKLVRDLIRAGDPNALAMIDEFHPRLSTSELDDDDLPRVKTADGQLIIARMYGFTSWSRLREHVALVSRHKFTPQAERDDVLDRRASFVVDACLDYAEDGPSPADRLAVAHHRLDADPSLASGSLDALATVGDHRALAAELDNNPGAVDEPCGPNGWPPLLYAVYSRVSTGNPDWSTIETVNALLDRGADPNAGFLWRGLVPPFTALTGAVGGGESHQSWPTARLELARLLLEAGADPNDGQLLYNNGIGGQNHDDPALLQLLVGYGLGTQQDGPWYQRLGDQLRQPSELLYDELEAAATRNRPRILGYLIDLDLDLNRPVGRSQSTPARIAATQGHDQILALLTDAGIKTKLTAIDLALGHTRSSRTAELQQLLENEPDLVRSLHAEHPGLCKNVAAGHADMLSMLIEAGFDINDRSDTKTGLHHAAEADDMARARLFIEHGADPNLVDSHIGATPWGWANHFGNDETADYLHPLTHHGDPWPEFVVRFGQTARTLVTPKLIDKLLDLIHERQPRPTLVRLEASQTSLSIGLGHREVSVALYRDADGRPWGAVGDPSLSGPEPISFGSLDQQSDYDFYPTAAVTVESARATARAFVLEPSTRPSALRWLPEGET